MATKSLWLDRSLLVGPYFCLCLNEKEYKAELDRLKIESHERRPYMPENGQACVHHYKSGDKHVCIVCMIGHEKRKFVEVVGLLAHEATHIWQNTKDIMGENNAGDEIEAYAMQNIVQELVGSYMKRTRKRNAN